MLVLLAGCAGFGDEDPAHSDASARPPVILVVFDEFPADDLLGPDGTIDAARYPNFAELASISTWFPNGHSIYDSTFNAVPAILDGRLPRPRAAPDIRSHKPNIFHLVNRLGYDVFKVESASALCPPAICPGKRTRRPGILRRLAGGGRPGRFRNWLDTIARRPRPAFYFHHALLPHEPWIYLPSGRQSRPAGHDPIPAINKPPGFDDPGLSVHNHLRHLLQVGYTDHLVGELLRRLRRAGLLERALLIVTADHGYSFRVGVESRRLLSAANIEEIAPVPFFVKAPGQMEGEVDEAPVRSVDIVATVADLLDARVFWRQDGRSAFAEETRERRTVAVQRRDFTKMVRITLPELQQRRSRWRRHWADVFGTGAESELLYGDPWAEAYRIGPNQELLDRRVEALRVRSRTPAASASVAYASLFGQVSPGAKYFPTRVTGPIRDVPVGKHRDMAVAVNGWIRAVGRSFDLRHPRREYFSLMVPEDALRRGANRVQVFEVRRGNLLVPVASAGSAARSGRA